MHDDDPREFPNQIFPKEGVSGAMHGSAITLFSSSSLHDKSDLAVKLPYKWASAYTAVDFSFKLLSGCPVHSLQISHRLNVSCF